MGRINKRSEAALKAAAEMLGTTKNQSIKAQLIRTVIDYDLRQQERADSRKAERRKRAENKELAGLRSKVQKLTDQLSCAERSKESEVSNLNAKLEEKTLTSATCEQNLADAEQTAVKARAATAQMQGRLKITQEMIEQLARSVCAEQRSNCGSELFQKWKSDAPELLAQVFESMGLDLKRWHSWDSEYGNDTDLMLQALLAPEKHEPEKLSLLRLKLSAMGMDYIDAIKAVHDYRDLKIGLAQLKERTRPHISFMHLDTWGLHIENGVPGKFMPLLTEEALRTAVQQMASDPIKRSEWLEIVEKLLKPDYGIEVLLTKERYAARAAADEVNGQKG